MTGSDEQKSSPQQDLMALLSNPDALRLLAFGARTMTRVMDTGREIGKVASVFTPGMPGAPDTEATPAQSASSAQSRSESAAASVPDGSLLVPIEAWNRVLDQLGNIHEAGQALAEARERAAKAEAVAEFQAERRTIAEATISQLAAELAAEKAPPAPPDVVTPSRRPNAFQRWWRG